MNVWSRLLVTATDREHCMASAKWYIFIFFWRIINASHEMIAWDVRFFKGSFPCRRTVKNTFPFFLWIHRTNKLTWQTAPSPHIQLHKHTLLCKAVMFILLLVGKFSSFFIYKFQRFSNPSYLCDINSIHTYFKLDQTRLIYVFNMQMKWTTHAIVW